MAMIYTPKQRALMELWRTNRLKRLNILEGSVSSGKTWISLVLWAFWVKTMPDTGLYLMCAKSLTTLKRNCLLLLQELVGESNFTFSPSAKEGYLFGRHIILEGANDIRSESKIRGVTLQGAYCDELTQFPHDFFEMLLSRLRLPGAKLIATTNPDSPMHWLKTGYIDRADELDFLDVRFLIDDNTTLPKDYVDSIKKEYVGVFYNRFILGEWCLAEGLVYDFFSEEQITDTVPVSQEYYVSVDYGTMNPFAAGLWCVESDGHATMVKEYYYDGRGERHQKTDEEYCDDMFAFCDGYPVQYFVVDPSATSFITSMKRRGFSVKHAKNDVLDGIRITARLLKNGYAKIHRSCENTIREFGLYSWDEDSSEDRVIKDNDHCLTGETIVNTENGDISIRELVGKAGRVWSYNTKTGQKELKPFTRVRKTGEGRQIFKITLSDGRFIRCTADHPILTERGYVLAKDLTENDRIVDITV